MQSFTTEEETLVRYRMDRDVVLLVIAKKYMISRCSDNCIIATEPHSLDNSQLPKNLRENVPIIVMLRFIVAGWPH